jgi:hypothetical protein
MNLATANSAKTVSDFSRHAEVSNSEAFFPLATREQTKMPQVEGDSADYILYLQ